MCTDFKEGKKLINLNMQKNILISGVGGQGILTIASIIDLAAMNLGLNLKQAEVHGMSQRGGAVESHLRISSKEIFSDLIPIGKADLILSIEPMESLRYLPFLSPEGLIVTTTEPYENINNYPDREMLMNSIRESASSMLVDAKSIAKEAGSPKVYNIALLGAASPYIGIDSGELEKAIENFFERKGDKIVEMNLKAFRLGIENREN
jgi:indolepyruvate ferredoxin oxidoreductase beta subunit